MSSHVEAAPGQNEAMFQDKKGIEVGQWKPIEDIKDPYVQEMGRFAVMEHDNMRIGENLKFICVQSGEKQVVEGMNYRLLIKASNHLGISSLYMAIVYDKPWEKTWKLIEFVPLLMN
ncbi:cysteine proteinase inhibitor 8-like [Cucurbita moschata]|uniref:Cysteine proteinase inhibitor 8-like n=1 Tax=Cucurbita moschata TaxID=3662 RepID=A0A6J1FCN5_CUCMO|nr:cysteine proteinase inhibitor 8-like [Cucurbita moschata]